MRRRFLINLPIVAILLEDLEECLVFALALLSHIVAPLSEAVDAFRSTHLVHGVRDGQVLIDGELQAAVENGCDGMVHVVPALERKVSSHKL